MCSNLFKTNNNKLLDVIERYINQKTSIDFILNKLIEFDKAKFILLSQAEIDAMKMINIPSLSLVLNNIKKDMIQDLWSKYEFNEGVNIVEVEKLEHGMKNENISVNMKRLLDLL